MQQKSRTISIIVPMYNEAAGIAKFYEALCGVLHTLPYDFEVLFVDDGSTDDTTDIVRQLEPLGHATPRGIELARNFGKEAATTAGLTAATGDAALMIDADLQHPVDKIPEFIEKWQTGSDVVVGVRRQSMSDSLVKKVGSNVFYRLIEKSTSTAITPHATDFRLIDRVVIDEFNRFTEHNRMTRNLIDWLGFQRDYVEFTANERQYGIPAYSLRKLFDLAINTFVASSTRPLRAFGWLGAILTAASGLLGLFVIIEQLILPDPLGLQFTGTAMIALLILFICGLILISLGIVSLYIGSMYAESLNRPLYVLKRSRRSDVVN